MFAASALGQQFESVGPVRTSVYDDKGQRLRIWKVWNIVLALRGLCGAR